MKKSYKGLWLWMILFLAGMFGLAFLPLEDEGLITRLLMNFMTLSLALIAWVIAKADRIYWYTGMSFEEAEKAGPERRKRYAVRHFRRFGWLALGYLVFSMAAQYLNWGIGWDIALATLGVVAAALSTLSIRL